MDSVSEGNLALRWPDKIACRKYPQIQATGLAPSDDRECAILQALAPGNYTAIVRGAGAIVGVGVVEAFNISQ